MTHILYCSTIIFLIYGCKPINHVPEFKRIDLDGRTVEASFLNDSVIDGEAKFYTSQGHLENVVMYKNGRKNGVFKGYYQNGKIRDSTFYKLGVQQGERFVFDSMGNLILKNYFYNGRAFGNTEIYRQGRIDKYYFTDFEKRQLFVGDYDSSGSIFRFGGDIVNAHLYNLDIDGDSSYGIFAYFLSPPNISIQYTLGLIEEKTKNKRELVELENSRIFIDTIVDKPMAGCNYYISATYKDTIVKYNKTFLNILKIEE